jgi:hypothetical protein
MARPPAQLAGRWGQQIQRKRASEEKKCFVLDQLEWSRQDKNLLYQHDEDTNYLK